MYTSVNVSFKKGDRMKKFFQSVGGSILMGIGAVGAFVATGDPMPGTPLWVPAVIALTSVATFALGYVLKTRVRHVPYLNWR